MPLHRRKRSGKQNRKWELPFRHISSSRIAPLIPRLLLCPLRSLVAVPLSPSLLPPQAPSTAPSSVAAARCPSLVIAPPAAGTSYRPDVARRDPSAVVTFPNPRLSRLSPPAARPALLQVAGFFDLPLPVETRPLKFQRHAQMLSALT
jgi:hypothetical protein